VAHDVFISYTIADKAAADAVCHRLEEAGIRCWIAPRDVGFGDWGATIVEAIGEAKLFVMILSGAANSSPNVLDEVVTALDAGAIVIPFRIEDIRPTGALRLRLSRLNWLDALSPPLDQHIDNLIEIAKRYLPAWREAEEARREQEDQQRQVEEEQHQQRQAEEALQRRQPEEQPRQPIKEPLRLLQVVEESHSPQGEPLKQLRTLTGHTNYVNYVTFSPDGRTLASGSSDNSVKLWDVANGKLLRTLTGPTSRVWSAAFSPDGRTLASASFDHTIMLWDTANNQLLRTLTIDHGAVFSAAFSPDGRTLASGSGDWIIRLWDVAKVNEAGK